MSVEQIECRAAEVTRQICFICKTELYMYNNATMAAHPPPRNSTGSPLLRKIKKS